MCTSYCYVLLTIRNILFDLNKSVVPLFFLEVFNIALPFLHLFHLLLDFNLESLTHLNNHKHQYKEA